MDPTMQQAVSETPESPDPVTVEPAETEEVATNGEAESGAPVPTYDQQFPSLGGGLGGPGGEGAAPSAPFGRWNAKPRVQSSTITQVGGVHYYDLLLSHLNLFSDLTLTLTTTLSSL